MADRPTGTNRFPRPTRARCGPFIELWHPDSPGSRLLIRPCIARRLGLIRSEFATLGETLRRYRDLDKQASDVVG